MTGRWVMASIQTSFAIMPAARLLVRRLRRSRSGVDAITIGTLVAFTTLQTRLFFPIGSLLSVVGSTCRPRSRSSTAIFEYLDQPVDIAEGTRELPGRAARRRRASRTSGSATTTDAWTLEDVSFDVPAGTKTALVGETGSGKTTLGYLVARLYDVDAGARHDRRRRRARADVPVARRPRSASSRRRPTSSTRRVRENLRFAKPGRDRRGDRGGRARRADPRR